MRVRHVRWLTVAWTVGLTLSTATAQTSQPSQPSGSSQFATGRTALAMPERPPTIPAPLLQPTSASQAPVTLPDPAPAATAQPLTTDGQSGLRGAGPFRVEPGRPLLEFVGSGTNSPHHGESNRWVDFSIVLQAEYLRNSPDDGPYTQYGFFRRLRPVIMGGIGDWQGILMPDFGAGENGNKWGTSIRWADIEYTGFDQAHLRFGSFKPWFSRELLTIGPHLQTIERSPVGDTTFGNPDYMIGIGWDQMLPGRKLAYYASVGLEDHVQSVTQMHMVSPAYADSGANQGMLVTGRLDYYLFGEMPYDPRPLHTPPQIVYNRGDFHTDDWRAIVSVGGYGWWNDDTSNPNTSNGVSTSATKPDLNRSYGFELSGGVRGYGFSADAEYQVIRGSLVDPTLTGGMYVGGQTTLNKFSVNGGYMFPHDIELAAGWSVIDATGFQDRLTESKFGVNWYVTKYAVRFSASYSFLSNVNGTPGNDLGVTRVLAQYIW